MDINFTPEGLNTQGSNKEGEDRESILSKFTGWDDPGRIISWNEVLYYQVLQPLAEY